MNLSTMSFNAKTSLAFPSFRSQKFWGTVSSSITSSSSFAVFHIILFNSFWKIRQQPMACFFETSCSAIHLSMAQCRILLLPAIIMVSTMSYMSLNVLNLGLMSYIVLMSLILAKLSYIVLQFFKFWSFIISIPTIL